MKQKEGCFDPYSCLADNISAVSEVFATII